uniref:Protein RSM22 n=1 Tax=Ascaris suum TaxID=6253 RepID=F1KU13_ASCSU
MLSQRRFPATPEEVREARKRIRKSLEEEEGGEINDDMFSQKVVDAKDAHIKRQVEKLLRRTRYNWRPLDFESKESAAVYTLARLAANFAEVRSVLSKFEGADFVPRTVLDYGSGCGGAFWAAHDLWGDQVEEYQLVEPNDHISKFCIDVLRGRSDNPDEALVHRNITFRRHLAPSPSNRFDLVIAHRVLVELASHDARIDLITSLWNRTNKYLVIIDSDLEDSFNAIMEARDYILIAGSEVHAAEMREMLHEMNIPNGDAAVKILDDKNLTNFERFALLREFIPAEVDLPTRLPTGFVFAPCPHDQGCPKLSSKNGSVCKFSTRWREIRADGKVGKRRDGTAIGSFAYVIMQKGIREPVENLACLLQVVHSDKHLTCTVCTPFIGIQRFTISKRAGPIYQSVKARKPGQLLPVTIKPVASESQFDVYEEAIKGFEKSAP